MKDRPTGLDAGILKASLAAWGREPVTLTHAPVGFGDHHWIATEADGRRTFVTVADLAHKPHCGPDAAAAWTGLRRAMDTAAPLRSADPGRELAVAPLRTDAGETLLRLTDRYAVSVFPYLEATAGRFGQVRQPPARRLLVERLAALHATTPPPATPVHDPALPDRALLDAVLENPHGLRAAPGPYTQRCRTLIAANSTSLRRTLEGFDRRTARLMTDAAATPVITHGEPHPGNILDPGGRSLLVDWDTVALAVPERDLWPATGDPADLAHYAQLTGHRTDPALLAHYALRWSLDDVTSALGVFTAPHAETADTQQTWEGLTDAMARLTGGRPPRG